jgi:hypothetical protein
MRRIPDRIHMITSDAQDIGQDFRMRRDRPDEDVFGGRENR